MKATLEFNLPEETQEHLQAVLAGRAWGSLYDITNVIRMNKKNDISADITLAMLEERINNVMMECME